MAQDQQQHTREKDTTFVGSLKGAHMEPPSWKTESKNIFSNDFDMTFFDIVQKFMPKGLKVIFFDPVAKMTTLCLEVD